jgi:hypothetical protein
MDYARDRRTRQIVEADKVRWTERNRAYECPVCTAAVHYRTAMGLRPYPGFAHNAHAGRLDCDLYHPSFGGEVLSGWTGALGDEETGEFDLCLDAQENWSLFLRFPEISDLRNARLRTLAEGAVHVVTGSDSKNISLMELRPGVGSGRRQAKVFRQLPNYPLDLDWCREFSKSLETPVGRYQTSSTTAAVLHDR